MNKTKVILLVYHGQGHFNACFRIAHILSSRYEVWFAGHAYFEKYILQHGFQFYPLTSVPFGLGFEKWINKQEKKKMIWWQQIKDRWRDRLYLLRSESLTKMMRDLNPTHILIDAWQSTDFIVLYDELKQNRVKVGFVQTMLSTIAQCDLPLNSKHLPGDKGIPRFSWQKIRERWIDKLKYLGLDNEAIVKRRLDRNGISKRYISLADSLFSITFNEIHEFILAPKAFEFPEFSFLPHQHYVGSMIDVNRTEEESPEFTNAFDSIDSQLKSKPLIYCSFGTTDLEESNHVNKFLTRLIPIIQKRGLLFLLSSGSKDTLDFVKNNYPGIDAFQHVPQLKILRHAKLFITHGGLNSIKEAIAFEVPLLVYPVRLNTDNLGNSARVIYHKLGLRGDLTKDSAGEIDAKLQTLLTNREFKNNLETFNLSSQQHNEEEFLTLFESLKTVF